MGCWKVGSGLIGMEILVVKKYCDLEKGVSEPLACAEKNQTFASFKFGDHVRDM